VDAGRRQRPHHRSRTLDALERPEIHRVQCASLGREHYVHRAHEPGGVHVGGQPTFLPLRGITKKRNNSFHFFFATGYPRAMEPLLTVIGIGLVGGVLSGLLGIGGGIITAPLLLYLPQTLGQAPLSMHEVSGLTMTQALFAGLVGTAAHRRQGTVDRKLVVVMSAAVAASSLTGAAGSRGVHPDVLLAIFVMLAFAAASLLLLPWPQGRAEYEPGSFSVPRAVAIASSVGLLGGLVGQGGSFLLIPALVVGLRVPLRVAMSSNLGIVLFASAAGFLGKAWTGQVPPALAFALVAGTAPGTLFGSRLSRKAPTVALRAVLGCVILVACARMLWDLIDRQ
jgi:uncharacterized protein